VTPREGLDADRVSSRAFVPTVASYAVHTRDCGEADEERIVAALRGVTLADGRPSFEGVWRGEDLYGRPGPVGAPAIVFAPAVGVRPSVSTSGPVTGPAADPGRGAHQRDGILLAHGPHVRAGEIGRTSIYDAAPTLLWLMDAAAPTGGDGRPLLELFDPRLVADRLPRVAAPSDFHAPSSDDAGSDAVLERLEALGYL
jgi:hypothetical protein